MEGTDGEDGQADRDQRAVHPESNVQRDEAEPLVCEPGHAAVGRIREWALHGRTSLAADAPDTVMSRSSSWARTSSLPTSPETVRDASQRWEFMLTVGLPDGYRLHPATLDAIERVADDRKLVFGATETDIRMWCVPRGETFATAHLDAHHVETGILDLLGLTSADVVERSVTPFETIDEAIRRADERDRPLGTVININDHANRGG